MRQASAATPARAASHCNALEWRRGRAALGSAAKPAQGSAITSTGRFESERSRCATYSEPAVIAAACSWAGAGMLGGAMKSSTTFAPFRRCSK